MPTSWFTFGQTHTHSCRAITFDKDIVVEITADDPRQVMFDTFGARWGHEYKEKPDMKYFPRGIYNFNQKD